MGKPEKTGHRMSTKGTHLHGVRGKEERETPIRQEWVCLTQGSGAPGLGSLPEAVFIGI